MPPPPHAGRRGGVDIEVVSGGEVDLLWGLEATDEELGLVSYGQAGNDLLVETPHGPLPPRFDELLLALAGRGYPLLLAHPERNPTFQRKPQRVAALVRRGLLLQVTAGALAPERTNPRSGRLATSLVREGLAHVLASDAHTAAGSRPADLRAGVAAAETLAPARAEWMVTEAPAAILAGEPLPLPPAGPRARLSLSARRWAWRPADGRQRWSR